MPHIIPEEELIAYAKPFLKARGFKKKNKRWTKDTGEFTVSFYLQGSSYDKDDYYIRPGIFINALPTDLSYGHFMTEFPQTTPEEVMQNFEKWCKEWTDKALIKERLLAFMAWEERNPLEKRRANQVDYEKDPIPAKEFLMLDTPPIKPSARQYILDNF